MKLGISDYFVIGTLLVGGAAWFVLKDTVMDKINHVTRVELSVNGSAEGHDWVDLGLPSGNRWATCNIGAKKPWGNGFFLAWGETKPKKDYNYKTYLWYDTHIKEDTVNNKGNISEKITITKYNPDTTSITTEHKLVLDEEDDAATANWDVQWRMPTKADQYELVYGCLWQWVENINGSGVSGRLGTSKKNGNTIFLPAAGYYSRTELNNTNKYGCYWSSSLAETGNDAYILTLSKDDITYHHYARPDGLTIRAVLK